MEKNFTDLRQQYPTFSYHSYDIEPQEDGLVLTFHFEIEGLCTFAPTTKIKTENLHLLNDYNSPLAQRIVFSLGMVELISYWKAACPKTVRVCCGNLSAEDIAFFKHLYFRGLSEFFYLNHIDTSEAEFMEIVCTSDAKAAEDAASTPYQDAGLHLIPVGGGKDSCVTAELCKRFGDKNIFFTVNDQPARTDTVLAAGYSEQSILRVYRTIDQNLLACNKAGFLNGHTPFSAIVAFLSYYCAYLIGAKDIVLSNESSANESNIAGTNINHQYSKSYEFETDFNTYTARNFGTGIRYFSLLRAFSELQIAKQFAAFPAYHDTFRSCNRGSRQNIWCGKCAKCLFVFSVLSPFLDYDRLCEIFGGDLLSDADLLADFDGLVGLSAVKPFDCVGTVREINFALCKTLEQFEKAHHPLPVLLRHFKEKANPEKVGDLLKERNELHHIPTEFLPMIEEMYHYVSQASGLS